MTQTDEMLARHEPPAEVQERVEQEWADSTFDIAANSSPGRLNAAIPRKRRSDAGIPKGPKPVKETPAPGALTAHQAAELKRLAAAMCVSKQLLTEAQRSNLQAVAEYFDYVDSLSAGK